MLKKGSKSGMIDMRSTMVFWGQRTWRIGVQHPRQKDKLLGVIELTGGQSLATSGDYERGQHIIDPRTGLPADKCQGVTLIGKNAAELDALSTAVFVLGTAEGMELISFLPEVEGIIVGASGQVYKSSGFIFKE
ncbi:MAG: FAD:protein FMN transferase [Candidatus Margulisbacteria bacterium]|nr:FAD:protein FMN transferase [Candidatus Margulisiibacteriota bacterium]